MSDVLILGSGVIGASIAYHLAVRGASVTLVDEAETATAPSATWASAGGLRSQGRHAAEHAITRAAAQRWVTLSDELDADLEVRLGGHLHLAETETETAVIEARIAADLAGGIAIERVDAGTIRELAPDLAPHLRLGAWTPRDGQASPALTMRAFSRAAERAGACRRFGQRATPFLRGGRVAGIQFPDGDSIAADTVILAAGAWSIALLAKFGIQLPIRWRGLQMLLSEPADVSLRATVTAVGRNLSLKRTPQGRLMIGGRWFAAADGPEIHVRPIEDRTRHQWNGAAAILPALRHLSIERSWAGAEAQTIDGMPFIGPVGPGGLYVATGFSNHGFQIAPVIGALVAEDLLDRCCAWLEPFRPDRPHLHAQEVLAAFLAPEPGV